MTPEDREKAIQALQSVAFEWAEPLDRPQAESYADAVLAALSPAEPVRATPKSELRRQAFVRGTCPVCFQKPPKGGKSQ